MNTSISTILQSINSIEAITSISLFCMFLIIVNFSRLTNPMRCLIALALVTYGLVGGLSWLEYRHDWESLFLYWGIFGAIAQFSLAGVVLAGVSGFPFGCLLILVLGFILCPLIWLRLVITILLTSFTSLPKRSFIGIIIGVASYFGFTYAPISVDITNSITNIINRAGDTNYYHYTDIHNNYYLQYLENIINKNKSNRQPIAYAITVTGDGYGEQTLTAGASYTAAQLSPCCGSLTSPYGSDKVVFSVTSGSDADSCVLTKGNAGFSIESSAGGSDNSIKATPGATITLRNNAGEDVRTLYVDSVLYLDEEGRSCSRSATMMNQALKQLRRIKF